MLPRASMYLVAGRSEAVSSRALQHIFWWLNSIEAEVGGSRRWHAGMLLFFGELRELAAEVVHDARLA